MWETRKGSLSYTDSTMVKQPDELCFVMTEKHSWKKSTNCYWTKGTSFTDQWKEDFLKDVEEQAVLNYTKSKATG
jgi:hypothetical protein